jgi:hypothetical protein
MSALRTTFTAAREPSRKPGDTVTVRSLERLATA